MLEYTFSYEHTVMSMPVIAQASVNLQFMLDADDLVN